jgi:ABC-type nitrate/sulfonate/bicarbonate transport system substrate-binding protein
MSMSFAHLLTFLRRATAVSIMLAFSVPTAWGATSPAKITIHIPGKSLAVMVLYFGKDKGLFFEEGIERSLWQCHRQSPLLL